ncbi:beta/gamma crystallin-related protein [Ramlibacter sp.]|uniref:beta/gamma crystallin-related protein n=1 Tax=Ramlibacter sp. TaxID=1917967 RepID=UPI003D0FBCF1
MLNTTLKTAVAAATVLLATQAMATITFYERENFRGRAVTVDKPIRNMDRQGLGDSAGSVVVDRGRWEVCEMPRFEGRCAVLRRGSYDNLRGSGLAWNISSVRPASEGRRYDLEPQAMTSQPYEYRRRANERTYEVPVNWSRAVVTQGNQQRCWVERQAVAAPQQQTNPGAAIAGAVIGGILGHQIGGGSGKDVATAAGVIGGAVVGNNMGGGGSGVATRDVQRCATVPTSATPAYYEVSYNYRGQEHRVQMQNAPGATIVVNARGEPRM